MTEVSVGSSDVEIVDSRRLGGAFVLDQLWERLGIAFCPAVGGQGTPHRYRCGRADLFRPRRPALSGAGIEVGRGQVAQERVALVGCPEFDDQAAYAAMDFLLASLPEIAERIFSTTANLLNLSSDIIFVDTSSTYFERDVADGEDDLDLAKSAEEKATGGKPDPDAAGPAESATRRFNKHSKDHRPDLPMW